MGMTRNIERQGKAESEVPLVIKGLSLSDITLSSATLTTAEAKISLKTLV